MGSASLTVAASQSLSVWWPTNGAHVSGTQPFKALVPELSVSQYDMFWQVDGGNLNSMYSSYVDYPHKEAQVDVSHWSWRGNGPYKITFVAKQGAATIASQSSDLYIDNPIATPVVVALPKTTAVLAEQIITPAHTTVSTSNSTWYVNPNSSAATQYTQWQTSRPDDAKKIAQIAGQPVAAWFGSWNSDVYTDVQTLVSGAAAQNATAILVAYNIPGRDCGGYSAGGSNSPEGYRAWIASVASAIGRASATVILEPDALAQMNCLSAADQSTRLSLLSEAITTLKKNPNTKVYLDAGHSGWIDPNTMAASLSKANVAAADGFSLNVSNFDTNETSITYGKDISSKIGSKHFVIDTSRNGNGSNGEWCNPSGRALGTNPTSQTSNTLVDAYLWIKAPGESDGSCNGGPAAGQWWADYALQLVNNRH